MKFDEDKTFWTFFITTGVIGVLSSLAILAILIGTGVFIFWLLFP